LAQAFWPRADLASSCIVSCTFAMISVVRLPLGVMAPLVWLAPVGATNTSALRGAASFSVASCVAPGEQCDMNADSPQSWCCGGTTCVRGAPLQDPIGVCMPSAGQDALLHYVANPQYNCYAGHGGVESGPVDGLQTFSAESCAQICDAVTTCQAFVYRQVTQTCWTRSAVDLTQCEVNSWIHQSNEYTTFTKKAEQCVQEGQTCGGPGLPDSTCCDGMQCERHFMGTHNLQCVVKEAQCVSSGQVCGCAGCLTQTCCDGKQCLEVSGQGGKLFCVDP